MTPGPQGNGDELYSRLEVPPGASHDDIARAYRRLAHDAHPDAHPGDTDAARRFREITEAYEVLGDPDRRERYDRARRQARAGAGRASQVPTERPFTPRPAAFRSSSPASGGPPVFLGAGPVTGAPRGLSVGPVQVGATPYLATPPPDEEEVAAALLTRLLAIFGPRWRS